MDQKLAKSCDKKVMKMAMLKHEKIFKEQVYELHRLYRIQKLLMDSMEQPTSQKQEIKWNSKDHQINGSAKSDQHNGDEQVVADSHCRRGLELIDESEIQLTLGPSIYKPSRQNHLQKRLSSGQSFSSSNSTVSSQIQNTDVPTREDFTWNFAPSTMNGRQMNLGEEHLRQDMMEKHPPWLFQALSLKLT